MREIGYVVRGFPRSAGIGCGTLSGSLTVQADPDSGLFSGDLALRPSTVRRAVLGPASSALPSR